MFIVSDGSYFVFVSSWFFFEGYGDHRDLHVLTHSIPTRRSSDLHAVGPDGPHQLFVPFDYRIVEVADRRRAGGMHPCDFENRQTNAATRTFDMIEIGRAHV